MTMEDNMRTYLEIAHSLIGIYGAPVAIGVAENQRAWHLSKNEFELSDLWTGVIGYLEWYETQKFLKEQSNA